MKEYNWIYKEPNPFLINDYEEHQVPRLLARVLANRDMDYDTFQKIRHKFWDMFYDYMKNIVNLNEAADRIIEIMKDPNYRIFIFSDYDADGITSASTVLKTWPLIRRDICDTEPYYSIDCYVPNRKEGYGLNMDWCRNLVDDFKQESYNVIKYVVITFDNGVSKVDEVKYLQNNGIEVIVTDHHEPQQTLPDCLIVDPKKDTNKFGEELCGSGIAWILTMAIFMKLKEDKIKLNEDTINQIKASIGNAAVGTVADMMPMTPFNISLVYNGLKYLNSDNKPIPCPYDPLKEYFNIDKITGKDIGFNIGAAINGCGQMGDIISALHLFACEPEEMESAAARVYELYSKARDITKKAKKKLDDEIAAGLFKEDLFCIYVAEDVPEGIAGKLANHITNTLGKPAIVTISNNNQNEWKGSGRSGNYTIDLLDILRPLIKEGLLKEAAGHKAACGVVLYPDKINELRKAVNDSVAKKIENGESRLKIVSNISVDAQIGVKDINKDTYNLLCEIPYSMNFSNPIFSIHGELLNVKRSLSNPNNICYTLKDISSRDKIDIWAWNIKPNLYKGNEKYMQIVGTIEPNFMKPGQITMSVIDLRFIQ